MHAQPVIAVFDVGKTNKKLLLFDQQYRMVEEQSIQLAETTDGDDCPCEDIQALTSWIEESFQNLVTRSDVQLQAVNFSAYGASFVYLDEKGQVLSPLYNYLKPYPQHLQDQFFRTHGGAALLSRETASPVLGSLNSGLQLYRIKYEQPVLFSRIYFALHLPQYLSYIIAHEAATDITSVGCHTMLWNYDQGAYHSWVYREGLHQLFAPLKKGTEYTTSTHNGQPVVVGMGLHDSSAALIPYLATFTEPFVLLSTGTWCISLNPFNFNPLTPEELSQDCLCYLSYEGTPVKASRLFAGDEHERQVKRLASHFGKDVAFYKQLAFQPELLCRQQASSCPIDSNNVSSFSERELAGFISYEQAYHQLIQDIIIQQVAALQRILMGAEKRLFVDGGFSKNVIYMHLLAAALPHLEVFAASVAQASALGAALAIHNSWNREPISHNLIDCKRFSVYDHSLSPER